MSASYSKFRSKSYHSQNHLCFYCEQPMWVDDRAAFALQYSISDKQAESYQCTAEHKTARQDGGLDSQDNIVAACRKCNRTRHLAKHPMPFDQYSKYVKSRMNKGKWHTERLFDNTLACRSTV